MKNDDSQNVLFMVVIAGREQKDELLTMLSESGAKLINTLYGKGTAKASYIKSILGLVPEENKVVITCVMTHPKAHVIMQNLDEDFHFNKPNTGIAFTIPVKQLSF